MQIIIFCPIFPGSLRVFKCFFSIFSHLTLLLIFTSRISIPSVLVTLLSPFFSDERSEIVKIKYTSFLCLLPASQNFLVFVCLFVCLFVFPLLAASAASGNPPARDQIQATPETYRAATPDP